MRAAILHGQEDLRIEDLAPVPLGPGEVRVRIGAALTCGTDLKVYRRGYHARMLRPPCVFGHEFAGTVSEVHPETPDWAVGDRVVAANSAPCGNCPACRRGQENLCPDLLFLNGAYAESIVVPARIVRKNLLRLPAHLSFADAALTEPLACVVQGLADLQPQPGESLLVLGSGPIGLMAAALARHAGAQVTVVGRGPERLLRARQLGATPVVNQAAEGVEAPELVGTTFDAVFEAVGKPSVWEAAVRWVRPGGRVNLFGGCPAGTTVTFDTTRLHYANLTLLASFHHTPRTIRRALEYLGDGIIRASDFVDGRANLEELPEVFRAMAGGNRAVKTLIDTPQPERSGPP
jgi:L-iditol 2-dehydrogenase